MKCRLSAKLVVATPSLERRRLHPSTPHPPRAPTLMFHAFVILSTIDFMPAWWVYSSTWPGRSNRK